MSGIFDPEKNHIPFFSPYFEKVCQLKQFIAFLQNALVKYQSDPAMINRINTMLSVLCFER
jgi:hypothetical protein